MFDIIIVPPGAAEFSEQMGTKFKFWYQDERYGLTLFKEGRPGTGENWAEKLAAELANLLGIPHASYEFALWQEKYGVISPSLIPSGERLIHGNELIVSKVTVDNKNENLRYYAQRNHLASRVFQFLKKYSDIIHPPENFPLIEGVNSALGVFVGYLMFDAWIANQDRHSENWGIIKGPSGFRLAPSYDHGSSMGRHETDAKRLTMLTTKDYGASINAYVERARSALYPNSASDAKVKAYLTMELFELAYKMDAEAGSVWISKLADISDTAIDEMIAKIPASFISDVARNFTSKLLKLNRDRLLSVSF